MRFFKLLGIGCIALALALPVSMPSGFAKESGSKNFAAKPPPSKPSQGKAAVSPSGGPSNAARAWLSYYKGEQKSVNYDTIARFIRAHPDFPAMNKLREEAEKAMPSSISDADALSWFSANPPQTTFGMKTYAAALIDQGQNQKAHEEINTWWRTANLTPADQSKGYMAFASILDKSAHQDRLRRLLYKGQYTNARAMAESLGSGYQALTEARIGLRTGKGNINGLLNRVPQSLQNDEGLLFDRLVYRRKTDNNAGALELLARSPSSDSMYDPEGWGKERGIMVRRLFEENKFAQAYKLAADHRIKSGPGFAANEWMAGWLALEYLKKPWDAFEHFERLYHNVETPISKSRAAYWAGLSSEYLGHPEVAQKWYEVGAKHTTTFYGQLSSAKLGRPQHVTTAAVSSSDAMKKSALAASAKWLRDNGYKAEAAMFLNQMIEKSKTPQDFAAAAALADDLSMRNISIKAAQECEKKNGTTMVGYAFPKIERYMNDVDVEWALVHALVRQESRYDQEAVSSAGARGLMQLMPGTAQEVAKKAGLSHDTKWLTSKPAHNVALGTRYLQRLLSKYDGNYAMALAAYNAGPSRVDRWITEIGDPRRPNVDLVNWIEMIPIYETRNYVQRVLEGVYVYRQTLAHNKGKPSNDIHLAAQ
ncbi:MAG: transglycosylase [Micavibrio aeruginosavorus]|uniref:Transglycosylase n=1 Tax=Micavibrio aeruginosavorus TaxID=349221 RepID=A0A2W5N4K1_9BACT|nr:MAG: transglycosylase [Micavibrio aeruginosavorus]